MQVVDTSLPASGDTSFLGEGVLIAFSPREFLPEPPERRNMGRSSLSPLSERENGKNSV